jgi:hypothetical protein
MNMASTGNRLTLVSRLPRLIVGILPDIISRWIVFLDMPYKTTALGNGNIRASMYLSNRGGTFFEYLLQYLNIPGIFNLLYTTLSLINARYKSGTYIP